MSEGDKSVKCNRARVRRMGRAGRRQFEVKWSRQALMRR